MMYEILWNIINRNELTVYIAGIPYMYNICEL